MTHYVEPDRQPTPRTDIIRRQDVIDGVGRLVDVYQEQQQAMLGTVQQAAHSGSFSTAEQVRERRYTSGMYLVFYALVVAMAMFGLTLIAWRNGLVDGYAGFAAWLVGTGAFALWLAWVRHGQEMEQTPEAVARHIIDWHGSVAEYDAETRRLALRWEHVADKRRQAAADADNAHARQMAQLRIAEMESRQRMQADRQTLDAPRPAPLDPPAITQHDDAPRPSPLAPETTWQAVLLTFVASLYERESTGWRNITDRGIITAQVPWSARAALPAADKQRMLDVLRSRPAIVEQGDGGRWRLRVELFSTVDGTVGLLSERCRRLSG